MVIGKPFVRRFEELNDDIEFLHKGEKEEYDFESLFKVETVEEDVDTTSEEVDMEKDIKSPKEEQKEEHHVDQRHSLTQSLTQREKESNNSENDEVFPDRGLLLNWLLAYDWQGHTEEAKKSWATKCDTRHTETFQRCGLIIGLLFRMLTIALIYGVKSQTSVFRTSRDDGGGNRTGLPLVQDTSFFDFDEIDGMDFLNITSDTCDSSTIDYTFSGSSERAFILEFSSNTTDILQRLSSCPDIDNFFRIIFPWITIITIFTWFILKGFLSNLQQKVKGKRLDDERRPSGAILSRIFSCMRYSEDVVLALIDLSLQSILEPISMLQLTTRENFRLDLTHFDTIFISVLLLGILVLFVACIAVVVLETLAIILEKILKIFSRASPLTIPRGKFGPCIAYYMIVIGLFLFGILTQIKFILRGIGIYSECIQDNMVNKCVDRVDVAQKISQSFISSLFTIPTEWWPANVSDPEPAIFTMTIFNFIAVGAIAPSAIISLLTIIGFVIDTLKILFKRVSDFWHCR